MINLWEPKSNRYNPNESHIKIIPNSLNEYSFCIGGDLQNKESVLSNSTEIIRLANSIGEFFIHVGDITHWATEDGWKPNILALEPIYNKNMIQQKYFALPGNHEWQEDSELERYNQIMDMPHNKFYYSITFGRIYIILATTGYKAFDGKFSFNKDKNCPQYQWFLNEALTAKSNPNIDWVIACTHYPDDNFTACNTWEPQQDGVDFANACIQCGVDICFVGHNHIYERTYPLNNQHQKSINGTIFITTGGMGGAFSRLKVNPKIDHIEKIIEKEFHFMKLNIKGKTLSCQMINDSGKTLDSFNLFAH